MKEKRYFNAYSRMLLAVSMAVLLWCSGIQKLDAADAKETAATLLSFEGLRPGLCVYLGDTDGDLLTELAAEGKYHVHALTPDQANVEKLRQSVASKGIYGQVVVDYSPLKDLPYPDNLVNVLIVEDFSTLLKNGLKAKELMRVVAPKRSVLIRNAPADLKQTIAQAGYKDAVINQKGVWTQIIKPWPEEMDDWPEINYDASWARISSDRLVQKPNSLQWIAERSGRHETGQAAVISMNGMVFSRYYDLGIVAHDAFSGMKLWQREAEPTYNNADSNGRPGCWIATKDELFTKLKVGGPLVALDTVTGKTLRTYDFSPLLLAYDDGRLFTISESKDAKNRAGPLIVYDARSGKELWRQDLGVPAKVYSSLNYRIIIAAGKVYLTLPVNPKFLSETTEFLCLDSETGKEIWRKPSNGESLVCYRNGILFSGGRTDRMNIYNVAYSPLDGSLLWRHDYRPVYHGGTPSSIFYLNGLVWVHDSIPSENVRYNKEPQEWHGLDPKSGKLVRRVPWMKTKQHCYDDRATERYIVSGGMDFIDTKDGVYNQFLGARGGCTAGGLPANGLYYQSPNVCACFSQVRGFTAFNADAQVADLSNQEPNLKPRQTGPGQPAEELPSPDDWPMFRHDPLRSGSTAVVLPENLTPLWSADLGGHLSSPVVACGKVYVSSIDDHRVLALDMKTGKEVWDFRANGRVDSPPTIYAGQAIFGCRDGWVYCVSSATGELIWKLQAAPRQRWLVGVGQVESAWPMHGSVLIDGDTAYLAAGRHSDVDGGVFFSAVSLKTGKALWQKRIDVTALPSGGRSANGSVANDILLTTEGTVFMGEYGFDAATGAQKNRSFFQSGGGGSFLIDTVTPIGGWHDLNYRPWSYYNGAYPLAKGFTLAFSGPHIFGIGATEDKKRRFNGYELFCNSREAKKKEVLWRTDLPKEVLPKALLHAGNKLYYAAVNEGEGASNGVILIHDAKDGKSLGSLPLNVKPKFDGMAAVKDNLIVVGQDGRIVSLGKK